MVNNQSGCSTLQALANEHCKFQNPTIKKTLIYQREFSSPDKVKLPDLPATAQGYSKNKDDADGPWVCWANTALLLEVSDVPGELARDLIRKWC